MSKTNLLVTGSAGFISSNLIRYMLKNFSEYKISSIDSIKDIKNINSIYYNGRHNFYISNITQPDIMDRIFEIEKPDIIIHGAVIQNSNNQDIVNTNILGTQNLIDLALKYKISKFIFLSSEKVYGPLSSESDPSFTESASLDPINIYLSSKVSAEYLVKAAGRTDGLKYNILRSCNNYGPRQNKDKLIPSIIKNIIEGTEMKLNNPMSIRSWLHVQDFSSAIKTIIDKGIDNEIYNVSSGAEFSNLEVFNEICNVAGKGHELLKCLSSQKDSVAFRFASDGSKLKNLGWKPEFKFKGADGGLGHNFNFYYNNQWLLK